MNVVLIAAQSLDGFITHHDQPGSAFTSDDDKRHFRAALANFPVRVMGSRTYEASRTWIKPRAGRATQIVLTKNPARYDAERFPGLEFSSETPAELVHRLKAQNQTALALIGGAGLHASFLQAGLVNELWITIESRLFGAGTPLIGGAVDAQLTLQSHDRLGANSLLLKYSVNRS